jgi:hypothetical protein
MGRKEPMSYETGSIVRKGIEGGFADWSLEGTCGTTEGFLALDAPAAVREVDTAAAPEPFYSGGAYLVGQATSPELPADFPFSDAIPSWNASVPDGTWIEILLSARLAGGDRKPARTWTRWYNLGVWAEGDATIRRHSVAGQDDDDASVAVDTLSLKSPADRIKMRLRLFRTDPAQTGAPSPQVRAIALAYSTPKSGGDAAIGEREPGDPALWGRMVPGVVRTSQMAYPNGGNVWCSPVCVSMVLGYWAGAGAEGRDERVHAAVAGVYDRVFDGHGNWSFNAAYAGASGYEARVARFRSLARLEPYIAAGLPVVLSVSWDAEKGRPLANAPVERSRGHLTLLVGFDAQGNPVMNEPAASPHDEAGRTYLRREFEARWLEASGGAAYLIYPPAKAKDLPGD